MISCALGAGLVPITEVGKKDPKAQPSAAEIVELALQDLEWGAHYVTIEARESGLGVGIFDERGNVRFDMLEEIARNVGPSLERLIWEAPLKSQQAALVRRFGSAVSLGNVQPEAILALHALRAGLRFETLAPLVERRRDAADWRPEEVEPDMSRVAAAPVRAT
jgi:phosphosulfolactate synthase